MATGNKFQKPEHRVDPLLKEIDPGKLQLSVLLWQDGLSFSVLNTESQELLAEVEHPYFHGEHPHEALHRIWASDRLLQLPYGKVGGAWETHAFAFIPEAFCTEETAREFLEVEFGPSEDPVKISPVGNALNLAARLPKELQDWWTLHLKDAPLQCLWLRFYQAVELIPQKTHVFVNAEPGRLALLVKGKNRPELLQHYTAGTPEDLAYYLLFALEQMGIDPRKTEVAMSGELAQDPGLNKLLKRYIPKLGTPASGNIKKSRGSSWLLHTQHLCVSSAAD